MEALLIALALTGVASQAVEYHQNSHNEVTQNERNCYSCSSQSSLCEHSVYDGQYLSSVACRAPCFLRVESNVTFRGCFDGWVSSQVRSDYEGCQMQYYNGQTVLWCFCNSKTDHQGAPCNGASQSALAKMANNPYEEEVVSYPQLMREPIVQPAYDVLRHSNEGYGKDDYQGYRHVVAGESDMAPENTYQHGGISGKARRRQDGKISRLGHVDQRQSYEKVADQEDEAATRNPMQNQRRRKQVQKRRQRMQEEPLKMSAGTLASAKMAAAAAAAGSTADASSSSALQRTDDPTRSRKRSPLKMASTEFVAPAIKWPSFTRNRSSARISNAPSSTNNRLQGSPKRMEDAGNVPMCGEGVKGTLQDPDDCTRYFLCSNGRPYHMRCPFGTQWSQNLRTCAFAFHPMYPCKMEDLINSRPLNHPSRRGDPYADVYDADG